MKNIDLITDAYPEETFLQADGFDDALIGVITDWNQTPRLAYSVTKCISVLQRDMNYEDAVEYFEYNVRGAYVGEKTPYFVDDDCL